MEQDYDYFNHLLKQFEALIHKTMNRLNIQQNNMDYEDFTQELQLQLIEIFKNFEGDPLNIDVDRYKFTTYAGQGLYWHGLDLLRQDKLDTLHITDNEQMDWLIENDKGVNLDSDTNLYVEDFLKQAKVRLSAEDYSLLLYIVEGKYTTDKLADLMQVSRDTIYQRRKKIQARLHSIKECLIN